MPDRLKCEICGGTGVLKAQHIYRNRMYSALFKCKCGICKYDYPEWKDAYRLRGYSLPTDKPKTSYIELTQTEREEKDAAIKLIRDVFGAEVVSERRLEPVGADDAPPPADGPTSEGCLCITDVVSSDDYECFGFNGR